MINRIKSCMKEFNVGESLEETINSIKGEYQYILLYKNNCIDFMSADADISYEKVSEIRLFDKEKELHIIRVNDIWCGRIRTDSDDGKDTDTVDENHLIWGKPKEKITGRGTLLTEDRGTSVIVPIEVDVGQRAYVAIRNYLDKDEFRFIDFRMVDIITGKDVEYAGF